MNNGNQIVPASGRRPTMIKNLIPSLPERGKIKIGVKGQMMKSRRGVDFQPPMKLDHFVITTLERGRDGNFLIDTELMTRLGDKPTEIPVRLLYDDPMLNFPTRYACFIGRTLWCSGDGEVATRLTELPTQLDEERVEIRPREVNCPCHRQDPAHQGRDRCKMNGALSVLIDGAGGLGGVWKFRTTSYNSIVGIMSSLSFLANVTGGVLANIPLKLRIQAKQAISPTDGGALTIYVVNLTFDGEPEQLQDRAHEIALRRAKTHVSIEHIEDEARRALALMPPANVALPGDDTNDVIEEFYPEQVGVLEPEREPGGEPGMHQEEESLEPEFTVTDNEGREFEFGRERAVKAIHAIFTDAQRYKDHARMAAAWSNNRVTIERLTQEGAAAEAAALTAYYGECRDLIPVRVHTATAETSEAEDGPAHAAPIEPPTQRAAQQDTMFPGDLPPGQRLVPRGVDTASEKVPTSSPAPASPPPANTDEPEPKDSYLIEPPMRGGKPDWRAWAKVLFLPQLRQVRHHYALFLGDNEENLQRAQAALPAEEWRELHAAKEGHWETLKQIATGGQG